MKSLIKSLKEIFSELFLILLIVIIVAISILSITSLWGITLNDELENDIAFVRLDTENSYLEMLREEDPESAENANSGLEVVEW